MTREEKQKAIDALKISAPVMAVTQEKFNDYIQTLNKVMDWLEQEPKWIPVSEMLPEEDGFYLATCDGEVCGESEPFSGLAEFENGKWVDDEEDYQCVVAWMPLPDPWKGET